MVTDGSETFRLYYMKTVVVRGAFGAADRDGVSKNVDNK
jgi:hypothetical protein